MLIHSVSMHEPNCTKMDGKRKALRFQLAAEVASRKWRLTANLCQLISFGTMGELDKLIEAARLGAVEDVKAIIRLHPKLVRERDEAGATAMHYAAFGGHRDVVRVLMEAGADINSTDSQFQSTPAGWAIEYLRGMGGFLGIELADLAWAIERGDVQWVARFLERFPALRQTHDYQGRAFREMAEKSENAEIRRLFEDPVR